MNATTDAAFRVYNTLIRQNNAGQHFFFIISKLSGTLDLCYNLSAYVCFLSQLVLSVSFDRSLAPGKKQVSNKKGPFALKATQKYLA